jgi:hypothetical protein
MIFRRANVIDRITELIFQRHQTAMLGIKIPRLCTVEEGTFQHMGFAG